MSKEKGKSQAFTVFAALIIVMTCLGTVFVLFPISNPLDVIGGTTGEGIFYASLIGVGFSFVALLLFGIKSSLLDLAESIGDELGIDVKEVGSQYKQIIRDEYLVLTGKKERTGDHYDDE